MNKPIIQVEKKFRPEIEGLRIVAAMLVAVYHIWFGRVSGGVDVFFVISGFLITSSIISTINRTHGFQFIPYISKLLKRLLPSVFFILSIVTIASFFLLPQSIFIKTIKEIIASLFYYENWQLAFSNTDYLNANQMKSPVEHFWAMSIQGQFYLIWFFLFTLILFCIKKFAIRNARLFMNVILLTLFVASLAYSIYLTSVNQPFAYFMTFARVWEFALGGLLCINLSYIHIHSYVAAVIGWVGFFGLFATGALFDVSNMFPGYVALWPMACAVMIVLAGTKPSKYNVSALLSQPILMKLGGISFGIYLWHWVLLSFYKYNVSTDISLLVGIVIIILSIIWSYLMTELIEKPIRQSTNVKKNVRRLVLMCLGNVVLIGMLFGNYEYDQKEAKEQYEKAKAAQSESSTNLYPGAQIVDTKEELSVEDPMPSFATAFEDYPISHKDDSNQGLKKFDVKVGEYGNTTSYKKTVAVVGSSHSEQWLGGVIEATKSMEDYRVLNITRSGTRFSTKYDSTDPKVEWINGVVAYLQKEQIDLVVLHGTTSDSKSKNIQNGLVQQAEMLSNVYGIQVLALRDNPRYTFNVLETLETEGYDSTVEKMNNEENQLDAAYWEQLKQSNTPLHLVDFSNYFKVDGEFRPVIGNVVVYRDYDHITNTFAESFAPMLKKEITTILESN